MFIKILYAVLVLCMVAVGWAIVAGYFRIRRHMNGSANSGTSTPEMKEQTRH